MRRFNGVLIMESKAERVDKALCVIPASCAAFQLVLWMSLSQNRCTVVGNMHRRSKLASFVIVERFRILLIFPFSEMKTPPDLAGRIEVRPIGKSHRKEGVVFMPDGNINSGCPSAEKPWENQVVSRHQGPASNGLKSIRNATKLQ